MSWNKSRLIGQKCPLLLKQFAIRVRLKLSDPIRDLALLNPAIDSKLRGCDLLPLRVADVYAAGQLNQRASITQSKANQPILFEIA